MIEVGRATPTEIEWIEEKLGVVLTRKARGIAAWDRGKILGVVAYDLWTANSVHAHMCVVEPIAWRRLLPVVFKAPFETRGILIGVIAASNKRSRILANRFGFKETHRIKDGARVGDDLVVHELRREDYHG